MLMQRSDETLQLTPEQVAQFGAELTEIRNEIYSAINHDDYRHLRKVESWGRLATIVGYATAWILPNPLTAFCLSLGQFTRWLLAHHITHRGYDRVPGIPARYTSKVFARGRRRFIDWFDWIHPDAWDYEHNVLHHYHTGEETDPDLVERHTEFLRNLRIPVFLKYVFIGFAALTWKYSYYAPNTMSVLDPDTNKRIRPDNIIYITIKNIFDFSSGHVRRLWLQCYLPYGTVHFLLIPLLFFPLGWQAVWFVLLNKLIAECITNVHSFMVIAPNHTADDLYRFDFHYENKNEFYVTQVLGSANYHCGTETLDYLSIYLNYQIEHHIFPDLPMTKYREVQPRIKALCQKYGIPYVQESMFKRVARMADVCVGRRNMRNMQSLFPPSAGKQLPRQEEYCSMH